MLASSFGAVLKQAREVRALSAGDAARAAGISAAYLSKLENDAVKRPSPNVLHQLSEALTLPYAELMRLSGYRVPGDHDRRAGDTVGGALFADLTDDERDELLEYLAWYRARRRSRRGTNGGG
jgi:HTH-type transcriptional regulator, competence development regulator